VAHYLLRRHVFQVELQAAGQNRRRQLLRVGSGQQELDVGRRLFQGFQQGVEAVPGQHVHLVDQVHLVARVGGCVLHVFQQFAGILHLGARGCIHFQQVDAAPLGDFQTGRAFPAGLGAYALFTVQALGQNPGNGRLAHAAGTGKQIRMVQAAVVQGVDQRLQHVLLTDHLPERPGSPFSRQYLIRHALRALQPGKRARIHQPLWETKRGTITGYFGKWR
jgi:hypothetical protein